jgi:hypothetical protein
MSISRFMSLNYENLTVNIGIPGLAHLQLWSLEPLVCYLTGTYRPVSSMSYFLDVYLHCSLLIVAASW